MDIIFGYITYWTLPIIKLLKYLKLNVYYIYVDDENEIKRNEIALKLKENNIYPLPLESEKKISPSASFSLCETDPGEVAYKKNLELVSDNMLTKYLSLFEVDKVKKLRLLIQGFISMQQMKISGKLGVWSAIYPGKKILYVSFKFKCFYNTETGKNISKVIIPLDFFNFLKKLITKIFKSKNINLQSKKNSDSSNLSELINKKVAFIPHKGITFGKRENMLFDKSLYYSDDKNSYFYKNNILHLDYSNYPKPEKELCWISFNNIKIPTLKVYLKTIFSSIKKIYLIRNWSTFLVWLFFTQQYNIYLKYFYKIKKFKNLKLALLDYDIVCPKTLVLALEKNNVKTVATQERFIHTFYSSYATVIVDTYYTVSEYTADLIKKSKYIDVKNIFAVGLYRSKYLTLYKNNIPEEIADAKQKGKKILVVLGYAPPKNWFESYTSLQLNWSSQLTFLEDSIKLSENLKNVFVIIRYKAFECPIRTNPYFKNIVKKINNNENIIICNDYNQPFYSYKLCANADLVIAKSTSIADECLSLGIPTLFYEYTHNMKGIQSDAFDYSPSKLMCYNFEQLLEKSKSLLFNNSSELKKEITKLKETIYYVKDKGNIKHKIIGQLENLISSI